MLKPSWARRARHFAGVAWLRTRQRARKIVRNWRLSNRARRIERGLVGWGPGPRGIFLVPGFGYGGAAKSMTRLAAALGQRGVPCLAIATEGTDKAEYPSYREAFTDCLDLSHEADKCDVLVRLLARLEPRFLFCALGVTAYRVLPALRERFPSMRVCDYVPAPGGGIDVCSLPTAPLIDVRIVESEDCRREMLKLYDQRSYGEELRRRLHVVPNSIRIPADLSNEDRLKSRRELGLEHDTFVVCYLGRYTAEKGLHTVLDVAELTSAENRRVRYVLAGDGPLYGEIEKAVEDRHLDRIIRMTGYLEDPAPVLAAADVLIAPSSREGMSNSVLEAMAQGKPILCTRVGALPEVVSDGLDGYLVERGDEMAETFGGHVIRLADDRELYERLSKQARRTIETRFDEEKRMHTFATLIWPEEAGETSTQREPEPGAGLEAESK